MEAGGWWPVVVVVVAFAGEVGCTRLLLQSIVYDPMPVLDAGARWETRSLIDVMKIESAYHTTKDASGISSLAKKKGTMGFRRAVGRERDGWRGLREAR
jgi:hypothetical protein